MATLSQAERLERAYSRLRILVGDWMETTSCPEKDFETTAELWHDVEQRMDAIVETIRWNEAFNSPPATKENEANRPCDHDRAGYLPDPTGYLTNTVDAGVLGKHR